MNLVVYLLDDGSTDETSTAVRVEFPDVHLFMGNGNLYWAGGMRIAYGKALEHDHDFYLWLNDDVDLDPESISNAISTRNDLRETVGGEHLIVGAMSAKDRMTTTYSGLVRASRFFPWRLKKVDPHPYKPVECETVNGNFVLIPGEVARRLGNIDPAYIQMHADLELGFSAKRIGVRNWIMARFAGVCDANTGRKSWKEPHLGLRERLRIMEHPLGYPLRPSIAYSKNYGIWAPIVVLAPYLTLFQAWLFPPGRRVK